MCFEMGQGELFRRVMERNFESYFGFMQGLCQRYLIVVFKVILMINLGLFRVQFQLILVD